MLALWFKRQAQRKPSTIEKGVNPKNEGHIYRLSGEIKLIQVEGKDQNLGISRERDDKLCGGSKSNLEQRFVKQKP